MLLVIPSIEIRNGRCAHAIEGHQGYSYSDDPLDMAKLWRKENAKSLHVTDLDGVASGKPVNLGLIKQMVKSVDIPIELGGGLRTFDDVKNALDTGIYRAVIGTLFIRDPDEAKRCIEKFGATKIVLGINAKNYSARIKGGNEAAGITSVSVALKAKEIGFRRIVYTDILTDGLIQRPNVENIELMAKKIQSRITVSGGISGLEDLLAVQQLEPFGIDSVIIGRSLYQNKFSCQRLWRLCETANYPYTARV